MSAGERRRAPPLHTAVTLSDPASTNNRIYGIDRAVPNLQRITVDGSDNADDYLKLHVDPASPDVFSSTRVPFASSAG